VRPSGLNRRLQHPVRRAGEGGGDPRAAGSVTSPATPRCRAGGGERVSGSMPRRTRSWFGPASAVRNRGRCGVLTSQSHTLWSALPAARVRLSGERHRVDVVGRLGQRRAIATGCSRFGDVHSRTVLSTLPAASVRPIGCECDGEYVVGRFGQPAQQAGAGQGPRCPTARRCGRPRPAATVRLSGLNATDCVVFVGPARSPDGSGTVWSVMSQSSTRPSLLAAARVRPFGERAMARERPYRGYPPIGRLRVIG